MPSAAAYQPPLTDVQASVITDDFDVFLRFEVFDPDLQSFQASGHRLKGSALNAWAVPELIVADGVAVWRAVRSGTLAFSDTEVGFAVYDPALPGWVQSRRQYQGSLQSSWTISGLRSARGMVAWQAAMTDDGPFRDAEVAWATYDPALGAWVQQQRIYQGTSFNHWVVTNLALADRVVAWKADSAGVSSLFDAEIGYAIYDASMRAWRQEERLYLGTSLNSWITTQPAAANSMVAWKADTAGLASPFDVEVGFALYDPALGSWQEDRRHYDGRPNDRWLISAPTVSNHRIQWAATNRSSSFMETRGYDASDGVWDQGPTAALAFFTASTLAGTPPLAVWFCDMSLGATAWNWDFGDGTASTERDPYHVFAQEGVFTVALSVSGPRGTSTVSRSITVAPLPLLLEAACLQNGGREFRAWLMGCPSNRPVVLLISTNLLDWLPLSTNTPTAGKLEIKQELNSGWSARFFKAVLR